MKASELIKRMQELIDEHGDHVVLYLDEYEITRIEYSHEPDIEPEYAFTLE